MLGTFNQPGYTVETGLGSLCLCSHQSQRGSVKVQGQLGLCTVSEQPEIHNETLFQKNYRNKKISSRAY